MKIVGLIIAAGLSSRADGYKMEYKIKGKTLIERAVLTFQPFCDEVIVVVGHNNLIIEEILKKYELVRFVYNEDYKNGMFSSVKKGIYKVECDKLLFMPGDYGIVKKETVEILLKYDSEIVIPSFDYKAGHPIVIRGDIINEIVLNKEFDSLKDFVKSKNKKYVDVEDIGVLKDIDTKEDYIKILELEDEY